MKKLVSIFLTMAIVVACKTNTELKVVKDTYSSGQTKSEFVYHNIKDKDNYTINEYYENGQLSFTAAVEKRMFIGKKVSYYEDGNLKEVDSLSKPCEIDYCCCEGLVTKYKANGQVDHSIEKPSGEENDLVRFFDDSTGKVDAIYTYANGKKNGSYTSYYPSGKVYSKGTYQNDTLVDYQYFFKENGDTMKYNYTFKGKMDFPYKKWLDNGQILTGHYSNKYNQVRYVWWDQNGKEIKKQLVNSNDKNWSIPD